MCAIETKYWFRGNFKPIVNILITTKNFTLLEIGCKDSIIDFIEYNFKLEMVDAPWMYEPLEEVSKFISSNKKHPTFVHEPRHHVEYFVNKTIRKLRCTLNGNLEP